MSSAGISFETIKVTRAASTHRRNPCIQFTCLSMHCKHKSPDPSYKTTASASSGVSLSVPEPVLFGHKFDKTSCLTSTSTPAHHFPSLMFTQTWREESVQLNNHNQSCEIAAKYSEFGMQSMPLINWKKCNYVWNNIFTFGLELIIYMLVTN